MTYDAAPQAPVVLRLEFSIADAVHQRGLFAVLGAAVHAWWNRPRLPANIPAYLRADLGLPPEAVPAHWTDVRLVTGVPDPLRRPGM